MMRSMYSGVSGLRVHQTKMDVIGNNIANVNTTGFKASSVAFSDIFYQTTQSASGPNELTGTAGTNAKQIGLGANLASIKASFTGGGAQRTDNPFDIMINGDAFFIVNNGGTNYFTKAGNFEIDAYGTLTASDGSPVMGWGVDAKDPNKIAPGEVHRLDVMGPANLSTSPAATTHAYFRGNIDKNDTQLVDGKPAQVQFYDSTGNLYTIKMSVKQKAGTGEYEVNIVDVMDINDKSIFVKYDATATPPEYVQSQEHTSISIGGVVYTPKIVDKNTGAVVLEGTAADGNTLHFNPGTGEFVKMGATDGSKSAVIQITSKVDGLFKDIDLDFSNLTMYNTSGRSTIESQRGSTKGIGAGKKVGNMTGVSIDQSGKIYGAYDNGDQKLLGQLAVATFSNPQGLEAVGNNRFTVTQNSGDFDGIGLDITANGGSFSTGVLEMSNVDLAQQFTDMITTQRGFQANSRIITTSDSLLEELVNLKR